MQTLRNISKRILAAFIFFTRLPFWHIANVEKRYYERVVPLWPLVGWLTGGVMAIMFWVATNICELSLGTSVAVALITRVIITGALHEDGFADFCDGFGGGTDRKRILEIMKDSHIGTYGVLGLILYYLLLWNVLISLFQHGMSPMMLIAADTACKYFSSTIIYVLPYARNATEAKNKLVYAHTPATERLLSCIIGLVPITSITTLGATGLNGMTGFKTLTTISLPVMLCLVLLFRLMHYRIKGYTGDCCGATFIITETVFYASISIFIQ